MINKENKLISCKTSSYSDEKLERFMSTKASMSYAQIMILIISMFAFSYFIYSIDNVNAQDIEDFGCCKEVINGEHEGESCQYVEQSDCSAGDFFQTQCEYTSGCEKGCCVSSQTGFCSKGSVEKDCSGQWFESKFCELPQCQRGCCIIGNQAQWVNERECEEYDGEFNVGVGSETECIFLTQRDTEGACVLGDVCKFTTQGECSDKAGSFYENSFCSDSDLGTDCNAKDHASCVEGEDSVYWFDSCGNKEDVKEECSLFTGTYCGTGLGGAPDCESVNCVDSHGNKRKNGESWCEYDGTIGNGKDVVGSRHVKHICYMGEERIEACQDYRNQICVGSEIDGFSEASCRVNNWRSCFDYNTQDSNEKMAEKCNENPDCMIKGAHIDKFNFDLCVPNYPPGFDLSSKQSGNNAEVVCGMATQSCTVVYVKKLSGWKCKINCGCEDSGFTQQMNDLCANLGDCGGYVNIAGEATDDGYTSGAGGIDLNQYKKYAKPNPDQEPAEPGDSNFLGALGLVSEEGDDEDGGIVSKAMKNSMGVAGVGFALQAASLYFGPYGHTISSAVSTAASSGGAVGMAPTATIGAFGNYIAVAGAVLSTASILTMAFDIDYTTALIIAGVATYAIYSGFIGAGGWGAVKLFGIYGLIALVILKYVIGIGKSKKKVINFQCLPWQPPTGGDDCNKCNTNNDLGVPCSDYRCQSLGQTCELINKGTEQEICFDNSPTDVSSPKISPLFGTISEGYEYYNIQNNGFELIEGSTLNCIPEFTPITYGIKTDKPAQCKVGTEPSMTYDMMEQYFGASNLYLTNHTSILNIPSPASFKNQYNLTNAQIADLGEIEFYIKCKSVNGVENGASYTIKSCVKPGPDLTAPRVVRTEPTNNYIQYNATEQDMKVWTNEPANCKYDIVDNNYVDMINEMNCQTDFEDYGLYGWACNSSLDVSVNNKFYIKCQDISENLNTMQESHIYELQKSTSQLFIDEVRPINNDEIFSGVEPVSVDLEIKTSGGAENGKTMCYYGSGENSILFFETDSNYHKQPLIDRIRGTYSFDLMCEDIAGNTATSSTSFKISIDEGGPKIIRMYYDSGLKIYTNEEAECRYAFDSSTNWEDKEIMSGGEFEHIADWQLKTYYVQCADTYGNKGGIKKIRAYNLV